MVGLSDAGGATDARATGILVKSPNMNDASPAMAAVAVIRSRLISIEDIRIHFIQQKEACSPSRQRLYSSANALVEVQAMLSGSLQTHVPPLSVMIDALTAMM
jgi:hypothetical protein